MVSSRVVVVGTGEYRDGKLTGVVGPRVSRLELPDEWLAPAPHRPVTDGGAFGDGIDGLTEDEVEEFLASL